MMQVLLIGALVGVLAALLVARRRERAYPKQRWMPDIRRVI
jgi:gas vesicle protein